MRQSSRQRIYAILLLVVTLMQLGVKITHRHNALAVVECYQCQHHIAHNGHLLEFNDDCDECLLCNVLANPFIASEKVFVESGNIGIEGKFGLFNDEIITGEWRQTFLRGPPCFLFITA